jgi:glycosyltransferase involved in cell wall biosynthesis
VSVISCNREPTLSPPSMTQPNELFHLSIVAPCFNEASGLGEFVKRLQSTLEKIDCTAEIILIDDGSRDETLKVACSLCDADQRIKVVSFLRNFGHQAAVTAGIDLATGDAVVLIDADLQDPPEVILEMIEAWKKGADVVYGKRLQRDGETVFKLITAKVFYRILRMLTDSDIPSDTGDFRLMDRKVVAVLRTMKERHRFIRGMVCWVGGVQVPVFYHRKSRFADASKYPIAKMAAFAVDAITSFSNVPLRLVSVLAVVVISISLFFAIGIFIVKLRFPGYFLPGYASIVLVVLFIGGIQLLALGLIGEYIARIFDASKGRPLYVVREIYSQVNR